jgi:hypothetical protein
VLAQAFLLLASLAHAEPVLGADYETGGIDGSPGVSAVPPAARDAITVSSAYARTGERSLRTELRWGPRWVSDGSPRAESNTLKLPASRYGEGDAFRYRFSLLLDPSWTPDARDSIDIVFQCKRVKSGPDVFVAVKGRDIVLRSPGGHQVDLVKDAPLGEWLDFTLDVRWSSGGDGEVRARAARASGAAAGVTAPGPTLPPGLEGRPGYVKWGLYKHDFDRSTRKAAPRVVYHDAVLIERL